MVSFVWMALSCAWITPSHHEERLDDLDGDGFTAKTGDCDDADAAIHPDAGDLDCDGFLTDDGDCNDADPAVNPDAGDLDCDGYTTAENDCDDADPNVHPDQLDLSCEDFDINCDGLEADTLYYPDADGDGFGDADDEGDCLNETGSVYSHDDCDDTDPDVWPDSPERCDLKMNDCADEGTWTEENEAGAVSLMVNGVWDDSQELTDLFSSGFDGEGGTIFYTLPPTGTLSVCPGSYFVGLEDDAAGSVVDIVAPYGAEPSTTLDQNSRYNFGSTVWIQSPISVISLTDLYITGGKDTTTGIAGSGVRLEGGSITIAGCTIQSNYGSQGGGLYNSGTATVDHTTIAGNQSTGDGGGIWNAPGASLTVNDSVITGNVASDNGNGGGLYLAGGVTEVTDSEIVANFAFGRDGGGIAMSSDAIGTLIRVKVDGNQATKQNGGGAYLTGEATLYVTGSAGSVANYGFTDNGAQELGGGVYITGEGASLQCTNWDFAGNITGDVYSTTGGQWDAPDTGLDWNGTCTIAGCEGR